MEVRAYSSLLLDRLINACTSRLANRRARFTYAIRAPSSLPLAAAFVRPRDPEQIIGADVVPDEVRSCSLACEKPLSPVPASECML